MDIKELVKDKKILIGVAVVVILILGAIIGASN